MLVSPRFEVPSALQKGQNVHFCLGNAVPATIWPHRYSAHDRRNCLDDRRACAARPAHGREHYQ